MCSSSALCITNYLPLKLLCFVTVKLAFSYIRILLWICWTPCNQLRQWKVSLRSLTMRHSNKLTTFQSYLQFWEVKYLLYIGFWNCKVHFVHFVLIFLHLIISYLWEYVDILIPDECIFHVKEVDWTAIWKFFTKKKVIEIFNLLLGLL